MMVIVDTSVWIDLVNDTETRQTLWLAGVVGIQQVGLTDLVLCEVLQGTPNQMVFANTRKHLQRFPIFHTGGEALAVSAASNYQRLRSRGFTIRKTIDCLIATFCLENNHALLHRDRDFDVFERELGLRVIHP